MFTQTTPQQNVQRVCPPGKLLALMADNDPYRGLDDDGKSNKKDFEEIVGAEVVIRHGKGHFNCSRLDEEDTRLVEAFLGVVREKAVVGTAAAAATVTEPKPRAATIKVVPSNMNAQQQQQQRRRRAHLSKPPRSKL